MNNTNDITPTKTTMSKEEETKKDTNINKLLEMEQKHKGNIPSLSREWIKKGKSILTEDKWEEWERIVPIRLNDLYHGMELGACLDIINILNNNGCFDEAKEKIESQNHSGLSFALVCSMVNRFSYRGKEFVDYINSSI